MRFASQHLSVTIVRLNEFTEWILGYYTRKTDNQMIPVFIEIRHIISFSLTTRLLFCSQHNHSTVIHLYYITVTRSTDQQYFHDSPLSQSENLPCGKSHPLVNLDHPAIYGTR
jgi:hypothetical protein